MRNISFSTLLRRDLLIAYRRRGEVANPLVFFVMVTTLVPLGLSPDAEQLSRIAPGIIWIMALLATLLSLEGLFSADYRDGSLEQLLICGEPLPILVLAKVFAHWLVTGLPLTLVSPLLGMMLNLSVAAYVPLILGLLLGTACLSLLGAVGAALTVSLSRGGLLLSLVVMPLYVPVIIFGTAVAQRATDGFPWSGPLALLGALLGTALALAPFASAGALRITAVD